LHNRIASFHDIHRLPTALLCLLLVHCVLLSPLCHAQSKKPTTRPTTRASVKRVHKKKPATTKPTKRYTLDQAYALYKRYRRGIVHIHTLGGEGTGFFIAKDIIATNYHVIKDGRSYTIRSFDNKKVKAKVIASRPGMDLALLKLNKPLAGALVLRIKEGLPKPATPVIAIGQPYAPYARSAPRSLGVLRWHWSVGHVTNSARFKVLTSAPIYPGNSGGPLLNMRGEVVGVIHAIVANRPGLALAIPTSQLKQIKNGTRNGYTKEWGTSVYLSLGLQTTFAEDIIPLPAVALRLAYFVDELQLSLHVRLSTNAPLGSFLQGGNDRINDFTFGVSGGYRWRARLGLLSLIFLLEGGLQLTRQERLKQTLDIAPQCTQNCTYTFKEQPVSERFILSIPIAFVWELNPLFFRFEASIRPMTIEQVTIFIAAGFHF